MSDFDATPQEVVAPAHLRMLLDHVQSALARENVDQAVADRVLNRLIYGTPHPMLATPMKHYTTVETTVSGELIHQTWPGDVLSALRAGTADLLGRLYHQAHALGDPLLDIGRVTSWEMRFEPKPGARFGEHLLRATAEVAMHRRPVSAADMEARVAQLLSTPRGPVEGAPR